MRDVWKAMLPVSGSPLAGLPFAAWCNPGIARAAPIVLDGDQFQIHPSPSAPAKAWRVTIAVRDAPPSWSEFERAVAGDIVDLAAISLTGDRVIATLTGCTDAIGVSVFDPQPVLHLRASPVVWLRGCRGAVLCRPIAQSIDYLRGFDHIVADSIAQGAAIQAALRRAYRGPDIRVVA
jgi:hypothetical protein